MLVVGTEVSARDDSDPKEVSARDSDLEDDAEAVIEEVDNDPGNAIQNGPYQDVADAPLIQQINAGVKPEDVQVYYEKVNPQDPQIMVQPPDKEEKVKHKVEDYMKPDRVQGAEDYIKIAKDDVLEEVYLDHQENDLISMSSLEVLLADSSSKFIILTQEQRGEEDRGGYWFGQQTLMEWLKNKHTDPVTREWIAKKTVEKLEKAMENSRHRVFVVYTDKQPKEKVETTNQHEPASGIPHGGHKDLKVLGTMTTYSQSGGSTTVNDGDSITRTEYESRPTVEQSVILGMASSFVEFIFGKKASAEPDTAYV